jgi:hypothetical protein
MFEGSVKKKARRVQLIEMRPLFSFQKEAKGIPLLWRGGAKRRGGS